MEPKSTSQNDEAVVLKDVTKYFGSLAAVFNASFVIKNGRLHSVIGPNGAGKTTLFNLICGNLACTSGQILFFGQDITHTPSYRRSRIGLGRTFQITNLFQELTLGENLMLAVGPKIFGLDHFRLAPMESSDALAILEEFGLADKWRTKIKNLSYGEQRQVEVVLGLALKAKVLFMDEPFAGLSPAEASQMIGIIGRIKGKVTVVLVEHDLDAVFELSDRIIVMHAGEILTEGTREEIRKDQRVQEVYLGGI